MLQPMASNVRGLVLEGAIINIACPILLSICESGKGGIGFWPKTPPNCCADVHKFGVYRKCCGGLDKSTYQVVGSFCLTLLLDLDHNHAAIG